MGKSQFTVIWYLPPLFQKELFGIAKYSPKGRKEGDLMEEKRALSNRQFAASGFDIKPYSFITTEGVYSGTLDFKRWGKKKNLLSYFTLTDGRKIFTSTFALQDYLGIADIRLGTSVKLTFIAARNSGEIYLRKVEIED